MPSIEIDKGIRISLVRSLIPDLAQQTDVDCAHQLLAQDVEAVCDVLLHDVGFVFERALGLGLVVLEVVVQRLAEEVLGMAVSGLRRLGWWRRCTKQCRWCRPSTLAG